jgi:uncharacterized OB-fold protein
VQEIFAILPAPTKETAPFWEGCNRGELLLCACEACGRAFYYPRLYCPDCGSGNLAWRASAGRGTLYSFTHVGVSFYGPKWESQIPYTLVLVDLDEGPRMLSRLVGERRSQARIGDRLDLEFVEVEKQKLPYFRIAGD